MKILRIEGSQLEKISVMNSNLRDFESVRIVDSNLSNLRAINSRLFEFRQLGQGIHSDKIGLLGGLFSTVMFGLVNVDTHSPAVQRITNKREIFKQIKTSYEQQGDRINSLKYKSYETRAHKKCLVITTKFWNKDRIIMILSSVNDYGLHWIKAFIIASVTMLVFYTWILVEVHPSLKYQVSFSYSLPTLKIWWAHLGLSFSFA